MKHDAKSRSDLATATLTIPGMGSDHCAGIVRTSLERLEGVQDITTSIAAHRARVTFDADSLTPADLKAAVERAGYEVDEIEGAGGPREVRLTVPGMGSDHCAGIVADSIRRLPGIGTLDTNIGNHRVRVSFDARQTDAQASAPPSGARATRWTRPTRARRPIMPAMPRQRTATLPAPGGGCGSRPCRRR
jgi:P-type Cu+ transporter